MSVPADSSPIVRTISCFDWKRLCELFAEVFPNLSSKRIAFLLMAHKKLIGVSEINGQLAGFYQFETRSENHVAWLNYIGVRDKYRSAGIGEKLLIEFERHARLYGLGTFELDVLEENGTAIRFYERRGYKRVFAHEHKGRSKLRYAKTTAEEPGEGGAARQPPPRPPSSFLERKYWRLVYLLLVEIPRGFR